MEYLLLALIPVGCCIQEVSKKNYNQKKGGAFSFSAASSFMAILVYILASGGELNFTAEILPYSIAFAVSYSLAMIGSFLAIKYGPLSISSLILQYSLLIPTVFGILVPDDPPKETNSWAIGIGIFLLIISLLLVNKKEKSVNKKISAKWVIFVLLAFFCNGCCSPIQRVQQQNFDGQYKNEFMIIAMLLSTASLAIMAILFERKTLAESVKKGFGWFTVCGLCNGGVNYSVIVLVNLLPSQIMFPIISAGSTILISIASVLFYKEKLTKIQYIGLTLGIFAIIALNL